MSNEEKEIYLKRYINECGRVCGLQEQLRAVIDTEQSAKIQQRSDMPKGGGGYKDLSDLMVKIEELKNQIQIAIIESIRVKVEIEYAIKNVPNSVEAKVLHAYFIEQKRTGEIGKIIGYSRRQTRRVLDRAITNINLSRLEDDVG